LNPIYHSDTAEKANHYAVEPYVIAADVYSVAPHTGRGGWTWYTGSSGWMYRLGIEAILGLRREGTRLRVEPRTAAEWESFEIDYRYGASVYHITVRNHAPVNSIEVDGTVLSEDAISLIDDGDSHQVIVHRENWNS
jgi:cellobiose phosphorylase